MIVYLAEAIDQHSEADRTLDRAVWLNLIDAGHTVYSPRRAWKGRPAGNDISAAVDAVNRAALRRADVMVAILQAGVASIGVPSEIEMFTQLGGTAVVIGDAPSVVLDANPRVIRLGVDEQFQWDGLCATLDSITARPSNRREVVDVWPDGGAVIPAALHRAAYGGNVRPLPGAGAGTRTVMYAPTGGDKDNIPPQAMSRSFTDDAGLDLVTATEHVVRQGEYHNISCGFAIALPDDVFGWVVARSSTFTRWGALVLPGIIDPGYRGEMCVACFFPFGESSPAPKPTDEWEFTIPAGTRLAQLVILPNTTRQFGAMKVDEFGQRPGAQIRGMAGWGSSGA